MVWGWHTVDICYYTAIKCKIVHFLHGGPLLYFANLPLNLLLICTKVIKSFQVGYHFSVVLMYCMEAEVYSINMFYYPNDQKLSNSLS